MQRVRAARLRAHVCVMQHRRPPTVVGGAHNSPLANATIIIEEWVSPLYTVYRLHLYNQSGVFYFPWHRHQVEGTYDF